MQRDLRFDQQSEVRLGKSHRCLPDNYVALPDDWLTMAASQRALYFGNFHHRTIKRILERGLEETSVAKPAAAQLSLLGSSFLRDPSYIISKKEVIA